MFQRFLTPSILTSSSTPNPTVTLPNTIGGDEKVVEANDDTLDANPALLPPNTTVESVRQRKGRGGVRRRRSRPPPRRRRRRKTVGVRKRRTVRRRRPPPRRRRRTRTVASSRRRKTTVNLASPFPPQDPFHYRGGADLERALKLS